MSPDASPSGGKSGSCGYPQAFVDQTPKYDNGIRKRKRKKKKGEK
jgi:hypothetical protein